MPVTPADLIRRRLANQRLSRAEDATPADAVGWLGARRPRRLSSKNHARI
jgi:hypothetical protein